MLLRFAQQVRKADWIVLSASANLRKNRLGAYTAETAGKFEGFPVCKKVHALAAPGSSIFIEVKRPFSLTRKLVNNSSN